MSMTPEEQRELAIECGGEYDSRGYIQEVVVFFPKELEAYTAAVEARVREEQRKVTVPAWAAQLEYVNKREQGRRQGRREERESLTKKLAEQQLAYKVLHDAAKKGGVVFTFFDPQKELAEYTAAVEAKERERIALHFEGQRTDSCPGTVISKEIRSLI